MVRLSESTTRAISHDSEVVVRVSLSAKISREASLEAVRGKPVEIDLLIDDPDVTWLRSSDQVVILAQKFREVLKIVRNEIPSCPRIHLFYAGPTLGAIILGQQINPRMNPPVVLYEYSNHTIPKHLYALTLQ